MINGLEGIPGSGKSYEAVTYHVLPALQTGRKVITNLPLNVDAFAAIDPSYRDLIEVRTRPAPCIGDWDASDIAARPAFQLWSDRAPVSSPESVFTFGTVWDYYSTWKDDSGRGPLFVVDECHVALPKLGTSDEIVQWFKLHRHFGADVLLITQSFRDINQPIAQLVAMLIKCRKADVLGKADRYIRKVHAGYRGALIQTDERPYKPQYFGLYRSHTQGGTVLESGASDVAPMIVHFNRVKWVVLALGVAASVWAFWPKQDRNVFGVRTGHVASQKHPALSSAPNLANSQAQAAKPAAAAASVPASAPKSAEPFDGKLLHITGVVAGAGKQLTTFAVSMNGLRIFDTTSDELAQAGYRWMHVSYCFGWLEYAGSKRPITCDAPAMTQGRSDRPIVLDASTGRRSDERADSRIPAGVPQYSAPMLEARQQQSQPQAQPGSSWSQGLAARNAQVRSVLDH